MKRLLTALAVTAGALLAPAAAQAACDPFGPAQLAGAISAPKQVLGFDFGQKDGTSAESDRGDQLPRARDVERALRRADVPVVMYRVP